MKTLLWIITALAIGVSAYYLGHHPGAIDAVESKVKQVDAPTPAPVVTDTTTNRPTIPQAMSARAVNAVEKRNDKEQAATAQ